MKVSFFKSTLFIIIIALFYRFILDLSYIVISDDYPVEFPIRTNTIKMILSYLMIIPLVRITCREKTILSYLFRVIVFFTIIPISSVYAMKDESSVFFLLTCLTYLATELILFKKNGNTDTIKLEIDPLKNSNLKLVRFFCFFILAITIVFMYVQLGVPSLMALVLDEVYDLRQSFQISTYTNYILYVSTQVCIPFGIADGYIRKSKLQIFIIILIQLVFFLWTGHKTWFFSIFLMLGIILLITFKKSIDYLFVALALICVIGFSFGKSDSIVGKSVSSLINRRVLLDPAALKFSYFDYFVVKGHSPNFVSGTVLAPVFSNSASKADEEYTYKISEEYTDKSSNAGTGLYGGDTASVGGLVFIIVPLSLLLLAFLTKKTEYYMGSIFTLLMLIYIFFSFNDQRIIQYMLDIRGVYLFAILYMLSKPNKKMNKRRIPKADAVTELYD